MNHRQEIERLEGMVLRQNRALVKIEARCDQLEQAILETDGMMRRMSEAEELALPSPPPPDAPRKIRA